MSLKISDKCNAELLIRDDSVNLEIPRPQQGVCVAGVNSPPVDVELEWVYGYRGRNAHSTLLYVEESNEIVYYAGCVVVLHDVCRKRQRFYREHNSHVRCIAIHKDKTTIATGQEIGRHKKQAEACVHLWRADTLETLITLKSEEEIKNSITQVCFSTVDGGILLGLVSSGKANEISVWDWKNEELKYKSGMIENPVYDLQFHTTKKQTELVSFGRGKLVKWSISGDGMVPSPIIVETKESPSGKVPYFTSFGFSPLGELAVGCSKGFIYIWRHEFAGNPLVVHSGSRLPVTCITFLPNGYLYTGHQNGSVGAWETTFHRLYNYYNLNEVYGYARNIVAGPLDTMYIGTTKNFILRGDLKGDFNTSIRVLISGHYDGLNAVSKGIEYQFVTAGKDKRLFLWDAIKRNCLWFSEVRFQMCSVALSLTGVHIAVGGITGEWALLNAKIGHSFQYGRACYCPINCIEFSPVGSFIAMGAQNGEIYVYHVAERALTQQGKLSQPYGPVTHLDWAVDSQHLRSCSDNRHIFYWSIPKCASEESDYVKFDHYWHTKHCTITYLSAGIWSNAKSLMDINTVDVSPGEKLLACGDDYGNLSIMNYPCPTMKAGKVSRDGHGTMVKVVQCLRGAARVITSGGDDWSIFQWKVQLKSVSD